MAVSVAAAQDVVASEHSARKSDRLFYSTGAWLCASTVLAGFSPTFFLAPLLDRPLVFLVGAGVGRIPLAQDLTAWLFL